MYYVLAQACTRITYGSHYAESYPTFSRSRLVKFRALCQHSSIYVSGVATASRATRRSRRSIRTGPADDHALRAVEPRNSRVGQLEVLLHKRGRRQREPLQRRRPDIRRARAAEGFGRAAYLREADILEDIRVEDLEELEGRVARVLDVMA